MQALQEGGGQSSKISRLGGLFSLEYEGILKNISTQLLFSGANDALEALMKVNKASNDAAVGVMRSLNPCCIMTAENVQIPKLAKHVAKNQLVFYCDLGSDGQVVLSLVEVTQEILLKLKQSELLTIHELLVQLQPSERKTMKFSLCSLNLYSDGSIVDGSVKTMEIDLITIFLKFSKPICTKTNTDLKNLIVCCGLLKESLCFHVLMIIGHDMTGLKIIKDFEPFKADFVMSFSPKESNQKKYIVGLDIPEPGFLDISNEDPEDWKVVKFGIPNMDVIKMESIDHLRGYSGSFIVVLYRIFGIEYSTRIGYWNSASGCFNVKITGINSFIESFCQIVCNKNDYALTVHIFNDDFERISFGLYKIDDVLESTGEFHLSCRLDHECTLNDNVNSFSFQLSSLNSSSFALVEFNFIIIGSVVCGDNEAKILLTRTINTLYNMDIVCFVPINFQQFMMTILNRNNKSMTVYGDLEKIHPISKIGGIHCPASGTRTGKKRKVEEVREEESSAIPDGVGSVAMFLAEAALAESSLGGGCASRGGD